MADYGNAAALKVNDMVSNTVIQLKPLKSENGGDTTPVVKKTTQSAIDERRQIDERKKDIEKAQEKKQKDEEVSQQMLDELSNDIESLHSIGLTFSKNKETGSTVISVINRDTNEVIREIPPKQVLDMAAKLDDMVGMLFHAKA
jgi:flagellar protein FlaG